jgi:hypothetical protein
LKQAERPMWLPAIVFLCSPSARDFGMIAF